MSVDGSTAWEGSVYHLCDHGGTTGLSVAEWNMNITYPLIEIPEYETDGPISPGEVLMTLSTPRRYLPGVEKIGTGDSWGFSYTLTYMDTSGTGMSVSVPVNGSYEDQGMTTIWTDIGTYEAWHISSDYTMALSSSGMFTDDWTAEVDYYWVEGLGLVFEEHIDTETGAILLRKELSSSVGL